MLGINYQFTLDEVGEDNAYEIKREGHKKIESTFQDDFNFILPVDIYTKKEVARRFLPDMDKVIKKCSKVIAMHSITSKPKRKRPWIVR